MIGPIYSESTPFGVANFTTQEMPTMWIPTFCCFGHPWSWGLLSWRCFRWFFQGFLSPRRFFRLPEMFLVSFDGALFNGKVTVGGTPKKINTFNSFFGMFSRMVLFGSLQEAMILLNESLIDWCIHHLHLWENSRSGWGWSCISSFVSWFLLKHPKLRWLDCVFKQFNVIFAYIVILLMEDILHHLGCIKPCK